MAAAVEPAVPTSAAAEDPRRSPAQLLTLGVLALLGFALGARPLADNSFLVHLRTGLDIVAGKGIPRTDPYSATAAGQRWVVQSWLPSATYGLAAKVEGLLVVEMGVLTAAVAVLVGLLVRGTTVRRTLAGALVCLAIGDAGLSPRPLLFGLTCFGLTLLVARGGRRPWLLVPVVWVWVNSHGSFPLGLAWLVAATVGAGIDLVVAHGGDGERAARAELGRWARATAWFAAGLAAACLNPLGPRLLLFPLAVGEHREVFQAIVEWRSPNFQRGEQVVAALGLSLVVLVVSRRRVPWALAGPASAFVLLALFAQRNLAPCAIAVAPALAAALAPEGGAPPAPSGGRARWRRPDRLVGAALGAAAIVLGANALLTAPLALGEYPVELVRRGEASGLLPRGRLVAAPDVVGCYLAFRRGRGAGVLVDDRYDMYPADVSRDVLALVAGRDKALEVLDRRKVDVVLWQRDGALTERLRLAGWQERDSDPRWVVLERPAR